MIDDPNAVRFDEIEIGNRFFDPTSEREEFVKTSEHTARSSGGVHLEFAPGHLVIGSVDVNRIGNTK